MGTRSAIIVKVGKEYKGIYCHWDGYPSRVGRLLDEHYNTQEKAEALVNLGDLSSLQERLEPEPQEIHSFDRPSEGVTVAYGRDRGETGIEAKIGPTVKSVANRIEHAYCYVFKDGEWKCGRRSIPSAIQFEEKGN